jgi:hypothetical protein
MTGAERQVRYRARQHPPAGSDQECAAPSARPGHQTKVRPLTRLQRWDAAVSAVLAVRAEYAAWYDALPEATRDGATGEALQAMIDLDLDELATIVPPRGFGRD